MWTHWYSCDIFYKYFTWNTVCILSFVLRSQAVSNKYNSERPYFAIRNGCLFEWLFTRRICGLLDSLCGKRWIQEGKEGRQTFFFFLAQSNVLPGVYFRARNTPEQTVGGNKCGRRERGREGGEEEKKKQGLTNRWRWMETGPTFSAVRWADAALDGFGATVQSAGSEGKCEALSPVCPAGRRVCDGRSPAASPEPSSQRPGSYCFSPFGCPAKGMKHRQIPSLETRQSLRLISHAHRKKKERPQWSCMTIPDLFRLTSESKCTQSCRLANCVEIQCSWQMG